MKREIITTSDGSTTIHLVDWDEHYHSRHGAVQEAYHVFIRNGLFKASSDPLSILEIGFGTGLNAFITYLEAGKNSLIVNYVGLEAYPLAPEELKQMNYVSVLEVPDQQFIFEKIHSCPWEQACKLTDNFSLVKRQMDFCEIDEANTYDLIYFDAFGPRVQPELWTVALFKKMFDALSDEGILVTYSAKGSVRRAMLEVGFTVERLPGPPGKREMLRATKPLST